MFVSEQRGGAMAVTMSMTVLGAFIAPICGSFIAASLGWRWTIWISAIAIGIVSVLCLLIVRETYAVKILARKVARLQRETGSSELRSKYQTQINAATAFETITKPLSIMTRSPVVFVLSLYTAIVYGTMYLAITTITEIMEDNYHFPHGTVGLAFLAFGIGNIIAMVFYGLTSDAYIKHRKKKQGNDFKLESRLAHMVLAAIILPPTFVFYGWVLQYHLPWPAPLVGAGFIGFGAVNTTLSVETYLVDAFPLWSALAIAAGVILRAISGALYPLTGPPLYDHLGLGWGNSVLALVLLAFVPFLVLLTIYGGRTRQKQSTSGS